MRMEPRQMGTTRELTNLWWEPFANAGYGFGYPPGRTGVTHLVKLETDNDSAVCGVTVFIRQDRGIQETPYVESTPCATCVRRGRELALLDVLLNVTEPAQLVTRAQAAIDLLVACVRCGRPMNLQEWRAGFRVHDQCQRPRRWPQTKV